jgi:hypothetical protein
MTLEQVFNEINSRKPDDLNVLTGLLDNSLFLAVLTFTVVVQVRSLTSLAQNCPKIYKP